VATLFNADGDGLLVVVEGCESAVKDAEIKISTHSVGSRTQHYRTYCYVDGALDLNGSVQVYTQAEFDETFGEREFTWDQVDGGELAIIFGLGIFMASSVYTMAWGCRKLMDMVSI